MIGGFRSEALTASDNLGLSRYLSFSALDNRHLPDIRVILQKCQFESAGHISHLLGRINISAIYRIHLEDSDFDYFVFFAMLHLNL